MNRPSPLSLLLGNRSYAAAAPGPLVPWRRGRRLAAVSGLTRMLLALLLAGAALAQAPVVTLGTWNIENLGFREPRRTDDDFTKIAQFITETGADVLAVQEIGGPEPLGRLIAKLPGWRFVLGESGGFRGESGRISVGFLWNDARIELLAAEDLRGVPTSVDGVPIFHRQPVTACFRSRDGGLDFRAIVVHLKASRGTANEHKRKLEIAVLREILTHLGRADGEDQDIVVLGDFNHSPGSAEHAGFVAGGLVTYATSSQARPTIVHFDDPIDHFALTADFRDELRHDSRSVHDRIARSDESRWRAHYSDHIPVTIQLDASRDRDPAAKFAPLAKWGGVALTASTAAPAAAPLEASGSPSGPGNEFVTGARVRVTTMMSNQVFEGTLTAPLGDWILLRDAAGVMRAIPRTSVHHVALIR